MISTSIRRYNSFSFSCFKEYMPLGGDISILRLTNCYNLATILRKAEKNQTLTPTFRVMEYSSDISPKKVTHPTICPNNDCVSSSSRRMSQVAHFIEDQAFIGVPLVPSLTTKEQRPKVYKQVPNSLSLGFLDINCVKSDYEHLDYLDLAIYEENNTSLLTHRKSARAHRNRSRRTTTCDTINGAGKKNQNAEHNPPRISTCKFGTRRLLDHARDDLKNQVCWYHNSWWNRRRRDLACQRPPMWGLAWVMEGCGFF